MQISTANLYGLIQVNGHDILHAASNVTPRVPLPVTLPLSHDLNAMQAGVRLPEH